MGARSSAGAVPSNAPLSTRLDRPRETDDNPSSVISVSARSSTNAASAAAVPDVFLSPRVIDQAVLDRTIAEFRSLVDEARQVQHHLGEMCQKSEQSRQSTEQASQQLQERLSLGARMLKAFQAQIEHVDASLATHGLMHGQMEEAIGKFQQLQRKLDEAAQRAGRNWTGSKSVADLALSTRVSEPVLVEVRTLADAVRSAASRVEELLTVIEDAGHVAPPLPFRASRA